jgi:hypothetical protein
MPSRRPGYGTGYDRARRELLAPGRICVHCRTRPATRSDHQPPLSLHRHVPGSGCCVLVPSCYECERLQAGLLGGPQAAVPTVEVVEVVEPEGFGPRDPVWDVPWLSGLRRVPADATWPRLMTVPHPRAVGSLGAEAARWARRRRGRKWRWWQRLYATRLLEVDDQGELIWEASLLSVARQVGKTWVLADLCDWRFEQGERFGGAQEVLSIAKDLAVVRKMQAPARARAKGLPERYAVREVNGQEEIELLADHSAWMIRSREGVYGLSSAMATVDEAWKIPAVVIDDGVVPTQVERTHTQLVLASTAHRLATALMIGRRAGALARLEDPEPYGATLLVEWSARRDAELGDRKAWRQASPQWTARRERIIAQRLTAVLAGESEDADEPDPRESFRTQWLNIWPAKRVPVGRGEELVSADEWHGAEVDVDTEGPVVVAVEDHFGRGAAAAACGTSVDGRLVVGGWMFFDRAGAFSWAVHWLQARPGSRLLVGPTLAEAAELVEMPVPAEPFGAAQIRVGLPLWRRLLTDGELVQDGSADLTAQVLDARVVPAGASGLSLVSGVRTDLVRAAVGAVRVAAESVGDPAIHWAPAVR